jgi:hypothetical protein
MTSTTIGPDGQYELRQQQVPKRQLIRTADELVKALETEPLRCGESTVLAVRLTAVMCCGIR